MASDFRHEIELYKHYTGCGLHGKGRYDNGTTVQMYIMFDRARAGRAENLRAKHHESNPKPRDVVRCEMRLATSYMAQVMTRGYPFVQEPEELEL